LKVRVTFIADAATKSRNVTAKTQSAEEIIRRLSRLHR